MVQTFGTIISLILASGAMLVIVASVRDEWDTFKRAVCLPRGAEAVMPPACIRSVAGARSGRFVRVRLDGEPLRAAA